MVKQRIAVIPARGGSKRIPEKNIIDFCGKPMIAWTIEAARNSGLFERILVSTDDPKIAEVSEMCGVEVPFLREKFADDYSPVSEATALAFRQAKRYWGEHYTTVVQLMANCPLRTSVDIQGAVSRFEQHSRSFQISCFKYGWMNPWWAVQLDITGKPTRLFPESAGKRSQDLPDLYCPTGAVWVAKAEDLLDHDTFYGPGHVFDPISWEGAVDIDDYDDLNFAKSVFYRMNNN